MNRTHEMSKVLRSVSEASAASNEHCQFIRYLQWQRVPEPGMDWTEKTLLWVAAGGLLVLVTEPIWSTLF